MVKIGYYMLGGTTDTLVLLTYANILIAGPMHHHDDEYYFERKIVLFCGIGWLEVCDDASRLVGCYVKVGIREVE